MRNIKLLAQSSNVESKQTTTLSWCKFESFNLIWKNLCVNYVIDIISILCFPPSAVVTHSLPRYNNTKSENFSFSSPFTWLPQFFFLQHFKKAKNLNHSLKKLSNNFKLECDAASLLHHSIYLNTPGTLLSFEICPKFLNFIIIFTPRTAPHRIQIFFLFLKCIFSSLVSQSRVHHSN